MIHGRNLIIYLNGTAIAACRDCELQIQADTIETSSATQDAWRTRIAGRKDWTVRASTLVSSITGPKNMVGTTVTLRLQDKTASVQRLTGSAIVKSWSVNAATGSLCKGSFSFEGTGPLT